MTIGERYRGARCSLHCTRRSCCAMARRLAAVLSAGWHRHPETRHLVLISRLASVPSRPAGDNCRSSRAAQVARIMPDNDGGAAGRPPAHNPTPTALVHCTLIKIRNSEPSASPHLHARLAHLSPRIPCLSTRLPVMPG